MNSNDSGGTDPTVALRDFITTGYGKEPLSEFTEKPLAETELGKVDVVYRHHHSEAFNSFAKMVRFHVHITQAKEAAPPVLWLSRNRYKTLRPTNKYFQMLKMELVGGAWTAVWGRMTFRSSEDRDSLQIDAANSGDQYDFWSMTRPGDTRSEKLTLEEGGAKRQAKRRRNAPSAKAREAASGIDLDEYPDVPF